MVGFNDYDTVERITKIGAVRKLLNVEGCLEFNPFLRNLDAESLSSLFGDIAQGAHAASEALSNLTNLPVTGLASIERAVDGTYARHRGDFENMDVTLSPLFISLVKGPYFGLREMETMELAGEDCPLDKAQLVMDGLAKVETFAKAVQIVYQHNAPIAAVA